MPFFDHFPYTNLHNVNLDWVLEKVKDWGAMVEDNNQRFEDLQTAYESFRDWLTGDYNNFKDYVTSYLENLDVQEEINNKLDSMFASGELTPYMRPYIIESVEDWLSENITPTTPPLDESLSIHGAAADAKAVGDAIGAIASALGESDIAESKEYQLNETVFDLSNVTPGQIIYYKIHMGASINLSGYIELRDSDNNRLGIFGIITTFQAASHIPSIGSLTIPDNFDHAIWTGSHSGYVDYITKQMPMEFFNRYYVNKYDIIPDAGYAPNMGYNAVTEANVTMTGYRLIHYAPVMPGSVLHFTYSLNSRTLGYAFYDININLIDKYISLPSETKEVDLNVPDNAAYIRITYKTSNANSHVYVIPPELTAMEYTESPYKRHTLKEYGGFYDGYSHVAFASIVNFAGKTVIVYRCGYNHDGSASSNTYADVQMDIRQPDGTFEHMQRFTASDFGAIGDARDFHLGVSRDGNYLFMLGGFNHIVNDVKQWDCIISCFDTNLNIVDYQLIAPSSDYFFGTPLITPAGHLLFSSFNRSLRNTNVYRSDTPFTGSVASLTFTTTDVFPGSPNHSECCLGYYNDMLILLIRCEDVNGKFFWTSDKEGQTGWSEATFTTRIEAPIILQNYKGDFLPFVGCHRYSNYRDGIIGYIKLDTTQNIAEIVTEGNLDTTLERSFNGYPCFISSGDEIYDVTYYQEYAASTITSDFNNTGLYYKRINARQIAPGLVYIS